jgi:3-deoxy-manno-octulosonate cytidylyltransferase (CMP-KDO synthetase)
MRKAVVVIPARFASTRFPGKPLATIQGKHLIQHVYEQVSTAQLIHAVFVATDDKRIFDAVTSFGGNAIMTSSHHTCGTDRIAEAARNLDFDIVVNVQGDEPFIRHEMVDDAVNMLLDNELASVSTLVKRTDNMEEILSPNVVKVVMDNEGFALYFSRSPIPFHRDEWKLQMMEQREHDEDYINTVDFFMQKTAPQNVYCYKHIGIYGYKKDALLEFSSLKKSRPEMIEKLEQLRALASGMKIKVKETTYDAFGIDTVEDIKRAEKWLNSYS